MSIYGYVCLTAFILSCSRCVVQGATEVTSLEITSNVSIRFADVNVKSTVVNGGKAGEEMSFEVQLPLAAFINKFSIFVNGEEFKGEIKENIEAIQIFSEAKESNEATGLITRQVRVDDNFDFELFKVQVYTPPESTLEFHLQYQELLERNLGVYTQKISINPKQIVPAINIVLNYNEPQGFQHFSYKIPTENAGEVQMESTDFTRKLVYTPSEVSQIAVNPDSGLADALSVEYDVIHDTEGGIIVENENHFTHYFSPECQNDLILSKRIAFIIDKSGSMKSPRIDYVKTALTAILTQLRPKDSFNLITFDDRISTWMPFLVDATPSNIIDALKYTNNIEASGATNIHQALMDGIQMFKGRGLSYDDSKVNVIAVLTDGVPTKGETNTIRIREAVAAENTLADGDKVTSVFTLAFGESTSADFLKRLAWSNGGAYTPIRTDKEADSLLLDFFEQVQDPYLDDVRFEYETGDDTGRSVTLTRNEFPQYFCGSELVVSGQLDEIDDGASYTDADVSDNPPADNPTFPQPIFGMQPRVFAKSNRTTVEFEASRKITIADTQKQGFLARIYAYNKIRDLIQEADSMTGIDNDMKLQLEAKALNLSLSYGFVTKLTSMVVHSVKKSPPLTPGSRDFKGPNKNMGVASRTGQSGQTFSIFNADDTTIDLSTLSADALRKDNGGMGHSASGLTALIATCVSLLMVLLLPLY